MVGSVVVSLITRVHIWQWICETLLLVLHLNLHSLSVNFLEHEHDHWCLLSPQEPLRLNSKADKVIYNDICERGAWLRDHRLVMDDEQGPSLGTVTRYALPERCPTKHRLDYWYVNFCISTHLPVEDAERSAQGNYDALRRNCHHFGLLLLASVQLVQAFNLIWRSDATIFGRHQVWRDLVLSACLSFRLLSCPIKT